MKKSRVHGTRGSDESPKSVNGGKKVFHTGDEDPKLVIGREKRPSYR
jgi:hypothetical protein